MRASERISSRVRGECGRNVKQQEQRLQHRRQQIEVVRRHPPSAARVARSFARAHARFASGWSIRELDSLFTLSNYNTTVMNRIPGASIYIIVADLQSLASASSLVIIRYISR